MCYWKAWPLHTRVTSFGIYSIACDGLERVRFGTTGINGCLRPRFGILNEVGNPERMVTDGGSDILKLTGVGERVGKQIMEVIEDIAKDLGETERIIVTSDVIESLNGRWKMLINGAAMPALGINTLLMPLLMGDPDKIDVKEALKRTSVADVAKWKKAPLG